MILTYQEEERGQLQVKLEPLSSSPSWNCNTKVFCLFLSEFFLVIKKLVFLVGTDLGKPPSTKCCAALSRLWSRPTLTFIYMQGGPSSLAREVFTFINKHAQPGRLQRPGEQHVIKQRECDCSQCSERNDSPAPLHSKWFFDAILKV